MTRSLLRASLTSISQTLSRRAANFSRPLAPPAYQMFLRAGEERLKNAWALE